MDNKRTQRDIIFSIIWIIWSCALMAFWRYQIAGELLITLILIFSIIIYSITLRLKKTAMFSRKTETPKAAEPIAPVMAEEKKPMPEQKLYTIIAKGTVFQGDINVDGDIQIWGKISGNINVKDGVIRVMHAGQVEGELTAPDIIIDGFVKGICAANNLDILEHGELRGTSRCGSMSIKRGGVFTGQSEQVEHQAKAVAQQRVVSIKEGTVNANKESVIAESKLKENKK
ncbi:TPA: polymer-forming cytoskeletal protein [Proteus mirabilis]|nr:polymer-forming cytoskeletal protein [Proteus mirabilis]EKW3342519.1 polymer-forming cytoskeletal protein [Proteus mirabilis]EKW4126361.1 polymer-forming cytoskeletal protein [Proteus mirabilis]ELA9899285.1 polymer-forming cytoskeletal protein [Proteus mirabilis]MBI6287154.1 polymer-forming cytoskeletal protein [Proteus mirabilis]